MSSRFSAARPRRAGEAFARQHHGGGKGGGDNNNNANARAAPKVTFDVRNPSALAPDARRDDDGDDDDDDNDGILAADVIGVAAAGATKRGAVNIDGYDSDSDNETFEARAEQRKRPGKKAGKAGGGGEIDLIDQLDNYDKRLRGEGEGDGGDGGDDDDDDDDMFGGDDDDENEKKKDDDDDATARKTRKDVRFLSDKDIEGQEDDSKGGGRVHLDPKKEDVEDDSDSSSDEEKIALAIQEEGVDEEVGPGGLKKHAPKLMAFNLRDEQEEGAFDEAGNFVRKAADPDAQHDRWMDGVSSKKQMKRAAAAHARREAELRQSRRRDDSILTADLLAALIRQLERGETALEALARLGKRNAAFAKTKNPKAKRIPQWKRKQMEKKGGAGDVMDVDRSASTPAAAEPEDPEHTKIKAGIEAITEAADKLLNRDYAEIYDMERERLMREYRAETGEEWVDAREESPAAPDENENENENTMWEYRWVDGRDGGVAQGPYDRPTMKAWQDAGYFEGVEFRPAGSEGAWRSVAF